MRILTVIYNLEIGGTQRAAVNFSTAYARHGHEVAVLAIQSAGPRLGELEAEGIRVFVGGTELDSALKGADDWHPDVVHIHRWGHQEAETAHVLGYLKKSGAVVFETNVFSLVDSSVDHSLIDVHLHLSKWCLWKWRRQIRKIGLNPEPLGCVVPYIVDTRRFYRVSEQEARRFRTRWGIPENAFVFGRVGQPHLGKWSTALLKAFGDVADSHRDVYLLVVGLPQELGGIVDSLPAAVRSRIVQVPALHGDAALRECYSAMDVFIHAADIGESFGMVLCEAMCCGVPVITLSTPRADNSQLEVVGHEKGGLVVSQSRFLSTAMRRMIMDQGMRNECSRLAPELIRNRYDGAAVIPDLIKIMTAACSAKNKSELQRGLSSTPGVITTVSDSEIMTLMSNSIGNPGFREWLFVKFPFVHHACQECMLIFRQLW